MDPNMVRKLVAEWLGTFSLLATGIGSGIMAERLADGNVALFGTREQVVTELARRKNGGQAPNINLGFYTIQWVDWWLVLLGLAFVLVTLFAPKGIGGLVDLITGRVAPNRQGMDLGPDAGSLQEAEAEK